MSAESGTLGLGKQHHRIDTLGRNHCVLIIPVPCPYLVRSNSWQIQLLTTYIRNPADWKNKGMANKEHLSPLFENQIIKNRTGTKGRDFILKNLECSGTKINY